MQDYKLIKINGQMVSGICKDYRCHNTLEYAEEIEKLNDFTLDNESIDSAYIPKLEFEFAKIDRDEFVWLMKNINQKSATLEYFDYTLGKVVKRDMILEGSEIEKLYFFGGNLSSILGLSVTFTSRKGYFTYEEL